MTKCDMATQTLDPVHTEAEDVYKMLLTLEKQADSSSSSPEIDEFMYSVVFSLRVQLLELSKLHSLVERFKITYCNQIKRLFPKDEDMSSPKDSDDESLPEPVTTELPLAPNPIQYLFRFPTTEELSHFISYGALKIPR
ncbi:hypothetical protein FO519_001103 [Halicephalobus sp. NKZ332]|nr:hypothetical protein FO519_001103 [Halicephalobus sp. NKZ332]